MAALTGTSLGHDILALLGIAGGRAPRSAARPSAGCESPITTLHAAVHSGLPYSAVEAMASAVAVPVQRLAKVAAIAPRTLARRRQGQTLSPEESDRVARIAAAFAHATRTLGSSEKASAWMAAANRGLGGRAPFDLLDTDVGTRLVEESLTQIAHGIVA